MNQISLASLFEVNESNDILYTVKEEIFETSDDQEICEQIFPIKSEVKLEAIDDVVDYQISSEEHEFQNSEGSQMAEIWENATVCKVVFMNMAKVSLSHPLDIFLFGNGFIPLSSL